MLYLSTLVFLPLVGILFIYCLPKILRNRYCRWVSIIIFLLQLILAIYVATLVNKHNHLGESYPNQLLLTENYSWINFKLSDTLSFNVNYLLAIDSISAVLVILSAFVFLISSFLSIEIQKKQAAYYSLVLLVSTAVTGCFLAFDLILFFLFYELMLFPLFFLIAIWGYRDKRSAAIKFFVFTFLASLLVLLSIIIIGLFASDISAHNFSVINLFKAIKDNGPLFTGINNATKQQFLSLLVFILMLIGFAVKIPLFPFHLWLPKAHTSAPTPISIILAGISLKVGYYALFRFVYGLFPQFVFTFAPFIIYWSIFTAIYAALNAFRSQDLKEMIAWSSINHMGFAVIALATLSQEGFNGAILQLLTHGVLTIALFLIPHIIYSRTNNRIISNFSGINKFMPKYVFISTLIFFISMGLPGFSAFVSEMLILTSLIKFFMLNDINILFASIFLIALFASALYMLKVIKNMFIGKVFFKDREWEVMLSDINTRESLVFIIVILLVLIMGIYPNIIFNLTEQSLLEFKEYLYTIK